jgi:hypothetical protein
MEPSSAAPSPPQQGNGGNDTFSSENREAVIVAKYLMIFQSSLAIFMLLFTLSLQILSIREKYTKLHVRVRRSDRILVWLFCLNFSAIMFYVLELNMVARNWVGMEELCLVTAAPFAPLTFIVPKQFLYYYLVEKSRIVHETLKLTHRSLRWFREGIALLIVIGLP